MVQNKVTNFIAVALAACSATSAFTTPPSTSKAFQANHSKLYMSNSEGDKNGGFFGAVGNFFEELDAFVDDATNRRLGGGAAFYGKRKSGFYGEADAGRKKDKNTSDPTGAYLTLTNKYFLVGINFETFSIKVLIYRFFSFF